MVRRLRSGREAEGGGGVMLVGAGFGGNSAAPIARKVLQAALQ